MEALPIDALLGSIEATLAAPGATLLLQAPPGAGKTTRVPGVALRALGQADGPASRVWMVEPRRLAARAAAQRLAAELGEPVGQRVGYSVRLERRVSAATRIEVLTGGLFLRRLQADPALEGVGCVVLDEFHERHADTDLALALVRQARELLAPDLRLVVMSATLELEALAAQMPEASVLRSAGRSHPVSVAHQVPRPDEPLARQVLRALESQGWPQPQAPAAADVAPGTTALVFLPGQAEIHACGRALEACAWGDAIDWVALHGSLPLEQQSAAIAAARPGRPKVVLATSLAESSLTIAGVGLVIDAGLSRRNRFDPGTGLDSLVTLPASRASAEQRTGRAGRLGPGHCVRLWSPAEQQRRPTHDPAALLEADPLPLALQLAWWGDPLGRELAWLDPPPAAALVEALQLLEQLQAIEANGRLSPYGRRLAELGLHPRLGHMLVVAEQWGAQPLASALAVLLSERDPLSRQDDGSDLLARLDWLRRRSSGHPLRRLQAQWLRQAAAGNASDPAVGAPGLPGHNLGDDSTLAARLVAAAYPERLALARADSQGRFLLRSGRGATLHPQDPLVGEPALAVAVLDGAQQDARILLAVPLPLEQLHALAEQQGQWLEQARWDASAGKVRCERTLRLDALMLERRPWPQADAAAVATALQEGLRQRGLTALPWTAATRQLQQRLNLAHQHLGEPWPDRRDSALLEQLSSWLGPCLEGMRSLDDLGQLDLAEALWAELPWSQRRELDQLLPGSLTLPTGRQVRLDYSGGAPVLAAKLQEFFGVAEGPTVLGGRLAVSLHLLSPAGRPAAITSDLAGFWAGGYRDVRRELRGRYPRHPWPEDGAQAQPTRLTKAALGQTGPTS